MPRAPLIVALATAWGPRFGGPNAFNAELLRSLGILPGRLSELMCVVPHAEPADVEDAGRYGVALHSLQGSKDQFPADAADRVWARVSPLAAESPCVWVGHDDKTGPLALDLRDRHAGTRAVLIHHMAHGLYQSVKKGQSVSAGGKRDTQRALFKQADLCLAVGPMLRDHLEDLLRAEPTSPPVRMLVPGLSDPEDCEIAVSKEAPTNFTAFIAGRLGIEDDRIKQGRLAVRGFGAAAKTAFRDAAHTENAIRKAPTLRMRGVRSNEEEEIRSLLRAAAGRELNCDILDYTEDRQAYFRDLSTSSVALMPSWHEGFGLAAWEAIACAVPVVIGTQSGVFRLLDETCQGIGVGKSVRSVQVEGHVGTAMEPNHTEEDVHAVAQQLLSLGAGMAQAKQNAYALREMLVRDKKYDWKGAAQTFVDTVQTCLDYRVLDSAPLAPQPLPKDVPRAADSAAVPAFLRPPTPRKWRHDAGLAPSALLNAHDQVVRFDQERERHVDDLLEWARGDDHPLSVRLVHGPGGIGKTRLALEVLRKLNRGEVGLWLTTDPPSNWQVRWAEWLEHRRRRGGDRLRRNPARGGASDSGHGARRGAEGLWAVRTESALTGADGAVVEDACTPLGLYGRCGCPAHRGGHRRHCGAT